MAKKISKANPIRFRPYTLGGSVINNDMPPVDQMANDVQYYKGIYPSVYYRVDWKLGEEIVIQIQSDDADFIPQTIQLFTPTGFEYINEIDVTPSGWADYKVYIYKYTPTIEGDYYFLTGYSDGRNWISDTFKAYENDKDLVKIQYYDAKNSYDGVFWDGTNWVWQPIKYITGQTIRGEGNSEYSIYKNQSNVPIKQRGEVNDSMLVNFTDISQHEKPIIDRIFGCDNILINGELVQNEEPVEYDPIPKSNLCNMSVNATITEDNNNSYNF